MTDKAKGISLAFLIIGCFCVLGAACFTFYNFYQDFRAAVTATEESEKLREIVLSPDALRERQSAGATQIPVATAAPTDDPEATQRPVEIDPEPTKPPLDMPVLEIDGVEYAAMLSIPDIELEIAVRANWSYPDLKNSPCRYAGSPYDRDLVICGHNYSTHFGHLKELEQGSEVILVDMTGTVFRYRVAEIEKLGPYDFTQMLNSRYDLTLFTCTVGGKARVTVRCLLVETIYPAVG